MQESPYQPPTAQISELGRGRRVVPQATLLITLCVVSLLLAALIIPGLISLMLAGDITVLCVLFALIASASVLAGAVVVARGNDRLGRIVFATATISAILSSASYFTVAMALCVIAGIFGFFACRNSQPRPPSARIEPT
jgi:hypothetical protein